MTRREIERLPGYVNISKLHMALCVIERDSDRGKRAMHRRAQQFPYL
jgi:hypothetical protein